METLISSETLLTFYQSTQRNIPDDLMLQSMAAVNFKLVRREEGVTSWFHNIITNPHDREIILNVNLMQQGNFIDVFLARHVSCTYAHHEECLMLSCSIWFSAPGFGCVVVLRAAAWLVCMVRMVHIRPLSGALDVELQHMVFCTEFWTCGGLESRCVGRVQKTIRCNSTSNAPDNGRMDPKHVELRIHQ